MGLSRCVYWVLSRYCVASVLGDECRDVNCRSNNVMVAISDEIRFVIHKVDRESIVVNCGKNEVNPCGCVIIIPRVRNMMWVEKSTSINEF